MNKKRIIIGLVILIVLGAVGIGIYYLNKEDADTTLTIFEKQWIENNKNQMIDIVVANDIPVFNYEGTGLVFDFLNDFQENINLEFNKLSYTKDALEELEYGFLVVDEPLESDTVVYQDYYVLLTLTDDEFTSPNQISNLTIGVLEDDLQAVSEQLKTGSNLYYKSYESEEEMIADLYAGNVYSIVIPKLLHLVDIISNEELQISYHMTGLSKYYVFRFGDNEKLNTILEKYYQKWMNENYTELFQKYFTDSYFEFSSYNEKDKVSFRSKRYTYGLINNTPYDGLLGSSLVGISSTVIREFSKLADIEISYQEYNNYQKLVDEFNNNNIDFYFNHSSISQYDTDIYEATLTYEEQMVVVSHYNNSDTILSLADLNGKTVLVLKDSKLASVLDDAKISYKAYSDMESMINKATTNSILVIDYDAYQYYVRNSLLKYKIDVTILMDDDYSYVLRDIKGNQIFRDYFSFYLSYINTGDVVNHGIQTLVMANDNSNIIQMMVLYVLSIIGLLSIIRRLLKKIIRPKDFHPSLSKEDKLKYIDILTSLKNRNYLNDHIEAWDSSEVYPQSIVIVDLNNIAYINDNYGHGEGDNVIKEAANILIKTQIENSEIIRTNGNEFLIYLVGYEEKQVIAYIRKLIKELKTLAHGFGAAAGYSMITDAIKTIDDAVNEATLDMKNNKQELK